MCFSRRFHAGAVNGPCTANTAAAGAQYRRSAWQARNALSLSDQIYLYNVQPFQLTANDFIFS